MLIDAHAHLDGYADRDEVIARARAAGLVHVVAVGQWREGAGMAAAQDAIGLAKTDRSFFSATAGIHPHDAASATDTDFDELRRLCSGSDVTAVGECGLDFHYDRSPRDVQRSVFVRQAPLMHTLPMGTMRARSPTMEVSPRRIAPPRSVVCCEARNAGHPVGSRSPAQTLPAQRTSSSGLPNRRVSSARRSSTLRCATPRRYSVA